MRALLTYLVDGLLSGKAAHLKESVIGIEVFRRDPGYTPKLDGVVRTEARRLRFKLQEYYSGSGASDTIRVELPKGGYVPTVSESIATPHQTVVIESPTLPQR